MSDQPVQQQPTENVGRGALFAAAAIPIAIVAFSLVGAFFGVGFVVAVVAVAIPSIAAFFYRTGAGTDLTRAGWPPFIGVTLAAIVLGTIAGLISGVYVGFSRVGGDGGLFGSAFATTLRNAFGRNFADNGLFILVGLAVGIVGLISVLRGRGVFAGNPSRLAPGTFPAGTPAAAADPSIPGAPVPPVSPPSASTPNAPSSGVLLNGKPIDPAPKKK